MSRSLLFRIAAGLVAVALFFVVRGDELRGPAEVMTGPPQAAETGPASPVPGVQVARPAIGFRSPRDFIAHYSKHAAEFGGISKAEYLHRAQALRDRPAAGGILEIVRADGVITRFDRSTGDFLAVNPDGTIRTFFRPSAGESYFQRQASRASEAP